MLKEVIIPPSFDETKIAHESYGAFQECNNLKKVTLPATLTELPPSIFYNCNSLYDINLDNIMRIDGYALKNTSVNIDLSTCSITSIYDHALENTPAVYKSELTLSPTITFVGKYALCASTANTKKAVLRSVTLSPNMDTLSEGVFAYHSQLNTINNIENIKVFDTSCLTSINMTKLGLNANTHECILSNQAIRKIGEYAFANSGFYTTMKKFDISNTYDGSTYSLKYIFNGSSAGNYNNHEYGWDINLSNSGVTLIDGSAFIVSSDPRSYNYKMKLNISNQRNCISFNKNCIKNKSTRSRQESVYGSYRYVNLIIDIDASNSSLGNIPNIDASVKMNWINVPLGEHVYIDPSTDFYVAYPNSAAGHTETINGVDTSVYGIDTLHLGPHMSTAADTLFPYIGGKTIWSCCRRIDFSESGFTSIPASYFGGTYGPSVNIMTEEYILGNNITSIPTAGFQQNRMLKKVDIGTGIQSIGFYAFADSPVEVLICRAATPPTLESGHNNYRLGLYHQNLSKAGCGIFVPDAAVNSYKTYWSGIDISGDEVHSVSYYIHPLSELEG